MNQFYVIAVEEKKNPVLEQRGLKLRRLFQRLLTNSDVPPMFVPAVLFCWACPASGVVQELGPVLGSPAEC